MKKKILSIALALCMVLTMMPMATGVAWAGTPASGVLIGEAELNAEKPYYHNGKAAESDVEDGSQGTADDNSTGANATFDSENGTLTLNGLNLTSGRIEATGDLTIKLEGENTLGNNSYGSCAIYVSGNLIISGPGKLFANNGNNSATTIYASVSITINNSAKVTATKAGGSAQAINAEGGNIVITNSATVIATNNGSGTDSYALLAGSIQGNISLKNIEVSNGATLTATSGYQAVRGSVSIDAANSDVYAGDSAPGDKLGNPSSPNTYTAKYLMIKPKAPVETALEDRSFSYAYDAQRDPAYPTKEQTVRLWDLSGPIMEDGQHGNLETLVGSKWTLTKAGTYSYMKSSGKATPNLEDIVKGVADGYSSLDPDTIVIHELKREGTHIAYGVVVAYDDANGYALFLGDTLSDGAGYFLSTIAKAGECSVTASAIATDFVQNISISLSPTDSYTFLAATVGYGAQTPVTATVTNTGNTATGALTVALSGNNADSFTLSPNSIISIAETNGTAQFTVAPKTGLTAGTYTATVTVSGQNIVSKSFEVSFTVKAPSGGGSYVPTTEKPTIIADEGAETTLSILGTKLTIKVADDYEITDVLVNGVSKGKVTEITGLKTGDKVEVKTEKKQEEPKEPTKEEIVAALDSSKLVARSKLITLKNGKKAVRVTWYDKNGKEVDFDGIEIYRSTQRYKGYGLKPFYATKDGKTEGYYVNTKDLKEGTTYYYKVRGYTEIDGQKYYTDYSLKAIRTIK